MTTPGPWHYEGHYILTDSEPQEIICERVSEANRGLIASAPTQQAKIEALADALTKITKAFEYALGFNFNAAEHALVKLSRAALKAAGRIP